MYRINCLALPINARTLYIKCFRYVINVACFDCVILCFQLRGRTYTRFDVYGNYDCAIVAYEIICMV